HIQSSIDTVRKCFCITKGNVQELRIEVTQTTFRLIYCSDWNISKAKRHNIQTDYASLPNFKCTTERINCHVSSFQPDRMSKCNFRLLGKGNACNISEDCFNTMHASYIYSRPPRRFR